MTGAARFNLDGNSYARTAESAIGNYEDNPAGQSGQVALVYAILAVAAEVRELRIQVRESAPIAGAGY